MYGERFARCAGLVVLCVLSAAPAGAQRARLERTGGEFATIQAAIGEAVDGDVITVFQGNFGERLNIFSKRLTLRSEDPNDPAVVAATVLEGDDRRKFIVGNATGGDLLLLGLTFQNSGGEAFRPDGAIQVRGGRLELIRCTLRGNLDTAIWCESGTVIARSCLFQGNSGAQGGAVRVLSGQFNAYYCRFEQNTATEGGALYGPASGFRCEFVDNVADAGGAAWGGGTYTDCTFAGNVAQAGGGGALAVPAGESLTVTSSRFRRNAAQDFGGAVRSAGAATLSNSVFVANSAGSAGGALANLAGGVVRLNLSTLVANEAAPAAPDSSGGGLYNAAGGDATVLNAVLWDNAAGDGSQLAGAGQFAVRYSLVPGGWPGAGNVDGDPLLVDGDGPDGVYGTADDDLSLGAGSPAVDAGSNGDVPADAMDLDEDGDTSEPLPLDVAGGPRFRNDPGVPDVGAGADPVVDMGAHEREGEADEPSCVGDWNGDGRIFAQDLVLLLKNFGRRHVPGDPVGDMDLDDDVDIIDLLLLLVRFGDDCD